MFNESKIDQTKSFENESLRKEQIQLISDFFKKAGEKKIPLHLFASFADEVVLNDGEIKQNHGDIDMICLRSDIQKIIGLLKEIGCENIKEIFGDQNYYSENLSLKVTARHGMVDIDLPIMDFDEQRQQPYYAITNNEGKKFRIYFEKDFLSNKKVKSTAGPINTVSPLGLIQTRVFYPALEGIELREKDKKAAEALRDKFFPGEDLADAKFMPEIVEVNP